MLISLRRASDKWTHMDIWLGRGSAAHGHRSVPAAAVTLGIRGYVSALIDRVRTGQRRVQDDGGATTRVRDGPTAVPSIVRPGCATPQRPVRFGAAGCTVHAGFTWHARPVRRRLAKMIGVKSLSDS